jgi:RNA polymerase sigma-70 factor (ECF subfamily)
MEPGDENLDELTDAALMGRIAVGHAEAVAPLFARYERPLLGLLLRAGSRPDAEDLLQLTWMRVVRGAGRYDPSQPFRNWLFQIAWNVLRDHWRRRREAASDEAIADRPAGGPPIENVIIERQEHDALLRMVESLPPRLAEAISLRFFEELSEREIAERLHIPKGTVKSRIHYGIQALQRYYRKAQTC